MTQTEFQKAVAEPVREVRLRSSFALEVVGVVAAFVLLTAFYMGPALTRCHTTIMGGQGDATAGGIWTSWQYQTLKIGPWLERTPYLNAPFGEQVWGPHMVTALGTFGPLWILTKLTSSVCAWNMMVFIGFMANGLLTYGFVRWLSGNSFAAGFAGFAYAFSPFHVIKAQSHMSYLHSYLLIALIWVLLAIWIRPSVSKGIMGGIVLAMLAYTDGYYILFAGVTIFAFLMALLTRSVRRMQCRELRPRLQALGSSFFTVLVLGAPILLAFVHKGDAIVQSVSRPKEDLSIYGARLHEYILPARTHPFFGPQLGDFQDSRLHGSNYSEQTLYLGWTVILLALVITLKAVFDRTCRAQRLPSGIKVGFATWVLLVIGVGAIAFSSPPRSELFGIALVGPSEFIYRLIPFWRVYSRLFLVVHLAFVALAGVSLGVFVRMRSRGGQAATGLALALILLFEFLTFPPRAVWSFEQAPPVYSWLGRQEDVNIVAEYPIWPRGHHEILNYLTWQVVHRKRLFNSQFAHGSNEDLRNGASGLGDPQTAPLLQHLGIDLVVVHTEHLSKVDPEYPPEAFEIVAQFGQTLVLRPRESPASSVVVATGAGFHLPELASWNTLRWMTSRGVLRLAGADEHERGMRHVVFSASSYIQPRMVIIAQHDQILWRGEVSVGATPIEFTAEIDSEILLTATPGAARGPATDTRPLAIAISHLDVRMP